MANRKNGFSVIELVIVIAVIAVLSTVLIPTFGNLIDDAQNSARDQKAKNAYTDYTTFHPTEDNSYLFIEIKHGGKTYYYSVLEGQIDLDHETENLSIDVEKIEPVKCTGYMVYPTSANALWQERWDDIINGDKEIKEVLIVSYNILSSTTPGGLELRSLKADEVSMAFSIVPALKPLNSAASLSERIHKSPSKYPFSGFDVYTTFPL